MIPLIIFVFGEFSSPVSHHTCAVRFTGISQYNWAKVSYPHRSGIMALGGALQLSRLRVMNVRDVSKAPESSVLGTESSSYKQIGSR